MALRKATHHLIPVYILSRTTAHDASLDNLHPLHILQSPNSFAATNGAICKGINPGLIFLIQQELLIYDDPVAIAIAKQIRVIFLY
jgi:hypothetical protein